MLAKIDTLGQAQHPRLEQFVRSGCLKFRCVPVHQPPSAPTSPTKQTTKHQTLIDRPTASGAQDKQGRFMICFHHALFVKLVTSELAKGERAWPVDTPSKLAVYPWITVATQG